MIILVGSRVDPIYLEVNSETKDKVVIKINGHTPKFVNYISYFIDPNQRFGKLYITCEHDAFYEIADFGEIKIVHGDWEIISDGNTPRSVKVKYKGVDVDGVKMIRWISDANKDVNQLIIEF